MNRVLTISLLLVVAVLANAASRKPQPEIMGIGLGMSRDNARARLHPMATLERETRKRQEVWAIQDKRISHLLVGYDVDFRVRYVTAIARVGGPRISYEEIADVKSAQQVRNQSNYKFTWEGAAAHGEFRYLLIAQGHDPEYLDSYSVKRLDKK